MTSDTAFATLPEAELVSSHGLAAISVKTELASALVYLQGAHLASFQPAGHEPLIWMSERAIYAPGKALRGGVPVCFPWFGPHPEHAAYPAHGFARTSEFQYRGARKGSHGTLELAFSLESDRRTLELFPYAFRTELRLAIGSTLGLELRVHNLDAQPFSFEEALHSYFSVSDVREVFVHGLRGAPYTDKVQGLTMRQEESELRFSAETDRVYESSARCTIEDARAGRRIHIEKEHSASTIVWNPWHDKAARLTDLGANAWQGMLCVESANVAHSRISLEPGQSHSLEVLVSIER